MKLLPWSESQSKHTLEKHFRVNIDAAGIIPFVLIWAPDDPTFTDTENTLKSQLIQNAAHI